MSASGTIRSAIRTGYEIQIVWTVDSQSVGNNRSTVTAKVQLVSTGASYTINSTATKNGNLTINGTAYSFTFSASLSGNQTKTIFTKTVTISHNADGSKTCAFSTVCGINVTLGGTYYGNVTASGSGVFNTIPRASTFSISPATLTMDGVNSVTISITRASSSFTHKVTYIYGSFVQSFSNVATSHSFAPPVTWLNAIPNGTKGTLVVSLETYSGSTKIGGTTWRQIDATAPDSAVPSISSVSLSDSVSGIAAQFGGYVQNKSKLSVSISASGIYGSTITSYKTTILGVNYSGASFTSGFLNASGNISVVVTVTDSRGRTASKTETVNVIAYTPPQIVSFTGFRSLSDGKENYEGTYLTAGIDFNVAPVGNKNTKSHKIEYKLQGAESWTTITSGSVYAMEQNYISNSGFMSVDNAYQIRLTVSDYFTSISSTIDIPTGFTLIDYRNSGLGIAFGKVAELDAMEIALDVYFRKKIIGLFPIGSIFMSVVNVNPSTYFGGTWVSWGAGRVPVGVNSDDASFNTVEKTGGSATHTLTTNEMPSHQHTLANGNTAGYKYDWTPNAVTLNGDTGWTWNANTNIVGGGAPHNNLQPYITCYMWKRTS